MPAKQYTIEGLGTLNVYKRKGSRSLRLSIQPDGSVRVTIPSYTPFAAGVAFAKTKQDWVAKHRKPVAEPLHTGQAIGKAHRLLFLRSLEAKQPATRLRQNEIIINYPAQLEYTDASVQAAAKRAGVRALRAEAEQLLPIRLKDLAAKYNFSYRSVYVKPLKTRWGSCDQSTNIVLNLYLIQLPWHLIDYVLLHELTHTHIMQHGAPFWEAMERLLPNIAALRKEIKEYRSTLDG